MTAVMKVAIGGSNAGNQWRSPAPVGEPPKPPMTHEPITLKRKRLKPGVASARVQRRWINGTCPPPGGSAQRNLLILNAGIRFTRTRIGRTIGIGALALLLSACQSIRNGWLDPTVVGRFEGSSTLEIRRSLTLEDTPRGIPGASYPWPEDLRFIEDDYPISAGDQLAIEIYELRDRQVPYQAQVQVSASGEINVPVIGRVHAAGKTLSQFEDSIVSTLKDQQILLQPQVTINPVFLQKATYSIFGIGVSASFNAPLRAGTFPIRRPDLRILEAINIVGGLSEFVTEVYVFRNYVPPERRNDKKSSSRFRHRIEHQKRVADLVDMPARVPTIGSQVSTHGTPPATPERDRRAAIRDVIDVVEADDEHHPNKRAHVEQKHDEPNHQPVSDDADALEPAPTLPYVWVNGEFVRNPAYVAPTPETPSREPEPLRFDNPSPTVNWARLSGESSYRIIGIPADALRNGDPEADIYVRPGDVIRIVSGEIGVYYVMGQVNRVGAFSFNAEEITLKAAIAAAGGLSALAWPDRCTVYRRIGQREQMIQVDLDRIFAGKDADFLIRRGDIINVGTHPFAPFLQRIRGFTLPNPVTNVGYSFTYARNFADIDSFSVRQNPANRPKQFPNLFP